MTKDDYRHFVCIVAGDNSEQLIDEYSSKEVEPYIVYRYNDASKIKKTTIEYYKKLKAVVQHPTEKAYLNDTIIDLEALTDDEFFETLADEHEDYYFNDNNDIMSDKNPKAKFSYCNIGKIFSVPFITKDGREVYQAKKSEIDWDKIHLNGGDAYKRVWEMVMENSTPMDEHEQVLYDNMKDKTAYFNKFETKENYIISNTAFWGYAFLSDVNGWLDAENEEDQFAWMSNYYNVFIKNLPEETLLTIYECKK